MTQKKLTTLDLQEMARQAMIARGFIPEFSSQIQGELSDIKEATAAHSEPLRDMRASLWISIDDEETQDLDQLTFAQQDSGKNKIFIAIADVTGLVAKDCEIDKQAAHNTTSVYTPFKTFPMLPLELSTHLTSLKAGEEREAIVVEIEVEEDGHFPLPKVYRALVRNQAKLSYTHVADWLNKKTSTVYSSLNIPGLWEQLKLQENLAQRLRAFRYSQGALSFGLPEIEPVMDNGIPVALEKSVHNRANVIIENFMITANSAITNYLLNQQVAVIKRVVKAPKHWDRIVALAAKYQEELPEEPNAKALQEFLFKRRQTDPSTFPDLSLAIIKLIGRGEYLIGTPENPSPGHFDLALPNYAHTTAPNRRYVDLVMQRLLKSFLYRKEQPYTHDELSQIALHCTQKEDDASKVERRMKKSAAAIVLSSQIGSQYASIVTGCSEKGVWVRLTALPIEGKLVEKCEGVDVGDHIDVKLVSVNVTEGFIDFVRI